MFQRRKALTQVQVILIAVIMVVAAVSGIYYYFAYIANPPTQTTTHSTTPLPPSLQPGTTKTQSFSHDGYNRTYMIHVSKIYDSNKPTPLLLALHGWGNSPELVSYYGFSEKSDKDGGIIIYPQGVGFSWNAVFGLGEAYTKKVDDVGFIRELIYRIEQRYNIDPNRVYVTGLSNGAMMTYSLGAELSDIIAGIAPVAGSIGGRTNQTAPLRVIDNPSQPVSVIVFHGTSDPWFSYNGKSAILHSLLVHDSVAFWVEADGCSKTATNTTSSDGKSIKCVYTGGKRGTEVVLYTLIGGGHLWPSVTKGSSLNATDLIWDFFKSHPKIR